MSVATDQQAHKKWKEEQTRSADWDEKKRRALWEVRKRAPGVISANLSSAALKGLDRTKIVSIIAELVKEGTFVVKRGAEDWEKRFSNEEVIVKISSLSQVFELGEVAP